MQGYLGVWCGSDTTPPHSSEQLLFKIKNFVQTGTKLKLRGTTLLPSAQTRLDSLGRANGRWASLVTGFGQRHLSLVWTGEASSTFGCSATPAGLTLFSRLAGGWFTTPAMMF